MFAIVQNGKVTSTTEVPRHVTINKQAYSPSDFCTPRGIRAGILPIVEEKPILAAESQELTGPEYEVKRDRVIARYTAVEVSLEVAKERAVAAVKAWRDAREFDPFEHEGLWFAGNEKAARRLSQEGLIANHAADSKKAYKNEWKAINGTLKIGKASEMIALVRARAFAFGAVFKASMEAEEAIAAAETPAAVQAAVDAFRVAHPAVTPLDAQESQRIRDRIAAGYPVDRTKRYILAE